MAHPTTRAWRDGRLVARDFPLDDVSDHREAGDLVWVDLDSREAADLHKIADELGLDQHAVEDALSSHERAKLDRYADYLFVNVYGATAGDGALRTTEISAFILPGALVTVRGDDAFDLAELQARWKPAMTAQGVTYLLHGLLDQVVDEHFTAIQRLDDDVEGLEDLVFDGSGDDQTLQRATYRLRRSLVLLRRVVLPMREIVNTLLRRDLALVPEPLAPYFQDVYDHTLRAAEWTEGLHDLVSNVMDTRIAMRGNQMNEVMKKVTSWAAIIAIPTAVTGFYGMNVPYPGFGRHWGFWAGVAALVLTSTGLYAVFKRRGWL